MDVLSENSSLCTNLTAQEAIGYKYTAAEVIFMTVLTPVISVFGVLANCAFLFVIYRVNSMRTTTNFFLANLAAADGMMLIISTMRYMWTYFDMPQMNYGDPFSSEVGCVIPVCLTYTSTCASMCFLVLVAFERYIAVCEPLLYRRKSSKRQIHVNMSLAMWFIAIAFVLPYVIFVELRTDCFIWPCTEEFVNYPTIVRKCVWKDWAVVTICLAHLMLFCTSFVANSFMYVRIVRSLSERNRSTSSENQLSRTRAHIARMLGINALVFFICLAPYQLINIADVVFVIANQVIFDNNAYDTLVWIGRFAILLNSTINPVLYSIINPDYRKAFFISFTKRSGSAYITEYNGESASNSVIGIHDKFNNGVVQMDCTINVPE